jgi:hypothetical protein
MPRALTLLLSLTILTGCPEQSVQAINAAPEASILSHAEGDQELEGYTVAFRGVVEDPDHATDTLLATWLIGGVTACAAATPDLDGASSCEITIGDDGGVTLEVRDPAGSVGSAHVNLDVVPTDAPDAEITEPIEGGLYYSDQKVTLAGLVTDTEDDPQDLTVWWESDEDGELDLDTQPDSDGVLSDGAYLSEGEHLLTLTALDSSGKTGSDSVLISVGPPNSAPTCEITAPVSGSAGPEGTVVSLEATVGDADLPDNELSVLWESDKDGELGESTPTSAGAVVYATSSLSVATHTITMTVTDEIGDSCTDLVVYTVGTPPSVSLDAPSGGEVFAEGTLISFSAQVSDGEDAPTDLALAWVSSVDGEISTQGADSTGLAGFTDSGLSVGEHALTLTVTDSDGLYATAMVTFTINGLPSAPVISLGPDPATTSDDLLVTIGTASVDPDGDAVSYAYAWYADGALSSASTSSTLPSSATTRDQLWTARVTPSDAHGSGSAGEASLTITNSPPVLASVTLSPDPASVADTLACTPASASDPDGDSVSYAYTWSVSGSDPGVSAASLTNSHFGRGDSVACTVTPSDSTDSGAAVASNTITVGNSAPSIATVTVGPDPAFAGDSLSCSYSGYSDPDGDTDASTFAWTISGVAAGSGASLSAAVVGGDAVLCTVTPSDGTDSGTPVSAAVLVSNSAPSISSVTISPNPATTTDTLFCGYSGFTDPDGDADLSNIDWTVAGVWASSGSTLAGAYVSGQTVACLVTPSDGADDGSQLSDSIVIDNSPPSVTSVLLSPSAVYTDDTVTASAATTDPDGDAVSLDYSWTVDGTVVLTGSASLAGTAFDKDDLLEVTVTPHDGDDPGSTGSASTTVLNTAPGAPGISISPAAPIEGEDLVCQVDTGSTDDDGDSVSYDFTWTVDSADYPSDWDTGFASSGWTGPTTTTHTDDTVPGADILEGEVWTCTVTPDDGDDPGTPASVSVTVEAAAGCPTVSHSSVIGGPGALYGYCWYLGLEGLTCDAVCSAVGGTNLAWSAESSFADSCSSPSSSGVSAWFYNNGNPGGWTGASSATGGHVLGYGYVSGGYYGKCSTGSSLIGTYPGETSTGSNRHLVCACATE